MYLNPHVVRKCFAQPCCKRPVFFNQDHPVPARKKHFGPGTDSGTDLEYYGTSGNMCSSIFYRMDIDLKILPELFER